VSGARSRPPGSAAILLAAALLVIACGQTVKPVTTAVPPAPSRSPSSAPSSEPFESSVYPGKGEAPCGQAKAPDPAHAGYRGELKRISAPDARTVVFELCGPDIAFLSKIAAPAFGIDDSAWLRSRIDPARTGAQAIVADVNGTGPYRLESWTHGTEISLARNDAYWDEAARNERVIVRWQDGASGRMNALQSATVDGIDAIDAAGVSKVEGDASLQAQPRTGLNVFYLGLNNAFPPFDNEAVRRALAMGIDRQHIVDTLFPPGSEVATHYAPCAVSHGCAGDPWYDYDPIQAKELLAAAGYADGFDTKIHYEVVARPYLPDPVGVAQELKTELAAIGIRAQLTVEPEDTFATNVAGGHLDGIHLGGQVAAYPDVSDLLDPRFGPGASNEFGKKLADVGKALAAGHSKADEGAREAAYAKANAAIRAHVPMVPVAHVGAVAAFRADVTGGQASPLGLERFASLTPGDRRQFVWLTTSEPPGLYCADETGAVAVLVCAQLKDGLYGYDPAGASTVPALAERCDPNAELTVWTCKLRQGVLFHDGAAFDASDVVLSFAVQWDADNPLHRGRVGTFQTFLDSFGGFLHPPSQPGG
jgi:peptide/nickel transport system substrate-binding protein